MFSWSFASRKEHSPMWYVIGIIVILVFVIYGITQGLYLMSIVSFLFAGVYILIENNSAPVTEVTMEEGYMLVGTSRFSYDDYASFSVISIGDVPSFVRFQPKKKLSAVIDIPLSHDVNPIELKRWLATQLHENTDAKLSNADAMIHLMKL